MRASSLLPARFPSLVALPLVAPMVVAASLAAVLLAVPAVAAPHHPAHKGAAVVAPKELGAFGRWIAATHGTGGQMVCYAFTRAGDEDPATGSGPILSVTDRPSGRNEVAVSGGPLYPKGAGVMVQVGATGLDFYTSGHDAFARDGRATVAAFERGATAVLHPPGKGAAPLSFSLTGFSAAHAAIRKACPPR